LFVWSWVQAEKTEENANRKWSGNNIWWIFSSFCF
jgi:hypothetical protein